MKSFKVAEHELKLKRKEHKGKDFILEFGIHGYEVVEVCRNNLKTYQGQGAGAINEYLLKQSPAVRGRIINLITDRICLRCFDESPNHCDCMDDE